MLWSIDSCQNRVSADQYHTTLSWAQVLTHRGHYFLRLSTDKLLVFQWSQPKSNFLNAWEISCAYQLHYQNFDLNPTWTRKFSQFLQVAEAVSFDSPWTRVVHALRPIFMLWLVKIWQVSSSGIFIQHLEICLLIAEVDRVLCHLVMLLTAYFHWM